MLGFDLQVMEWIQTLHRLGGSAMDLFFACCTFLGEETFLLVAVFGLYWCANKRLGELMLLSLFSSLGLNGLCKDLVRRPRPFLTSGFEDRRYVVIENFLVNTTKLGESFSFPSGHSQCAGAFFGTLALWSRKKGEVLFCTLAVALVMVSRVYLGVHFPTDVLAGGLVGVGMAWLSWALFRRFYEKKIWIFGGAVLLASLGLLVEPSPDTIKTVGVGIGALLGLLWEEKVNFSVDGTLPRRILRLVAGGALLMLVRVGLKALLPEGLLFDGLRYACVGAAATGFWPWAFTRLKL